MIDLQGYTKRLTAVLFAALGITFFSGRASAAPTTPPLCSEIAMTTTDSNGGSTLLVMGGSDGKAYYQVRPNLSASTPWVALFGGRALFPACAPFAIGLSGSNIDVFGIGNDGLMYTAYTSGSGWNYGSMGGTFYPGAAVAVVERYVGRRQIDLFATGTDGRIWTTWWNNGWNAWGAIGTQKFPQSNPILAFPHGTSSHPDDLGQLDLYVVANNNQLWTNYFDWFSPGWHSWGVIGSGFSGGRVSATSRIYDTGNWLFHNMVQQLDLFGVNGNHGLITTYWNNGWYSGGWGVIPNITMADGTGVAADVFNVSGTTVSGIGLYTTDSSGYLRRANWQSGQGWSAWSYFPNSPRVISPINTSIQEAWGDVYLYNGNKFSYARLDDGALFSLVN